MIDDQYAHTLANTQTSKPLICFELSIIIE
jgi:hypothetical protein